PAHSVARALLRAAKVPIAAPSANRSGHVSPTTAAHVAADLGDRVAMILDGGVATIGLESTVVDATGADPVVLRLGAASRADIARRRGGELPVATGETDTPSSPGMLVRHYAPAARLRLNATGAAEDPDEALLAFGTSQVPPHAGAMLNLSWSGDLR